MGAFGKMMLLGVVIALGGLAYYEFSGSNDGITGLDAYDKMFNRSSALSCLKKYQVAQNVFQMQSDGRFAARMEDLFKEGELIDGKFYRAWAGHATPEPIHGYVFVEIAPAVPHGQCGLTAYPVAPGISGDTMLVLFMDDTHGGPPPDFEGGAFTPGPDEIQIWEASYTSDSKPVTTWIAPEQRPATMKRLDSFVVSTPKR